MTRAEYVLNRIITDEAKTIMQSMDDDKDGLIQREEFIRNTEDLLMDVELCERVFSVFDPNSDGITTIPEYLRTWGIWARDGRPSAKERLDAICENLRDAG